MDRLGSVYLVPETIHTPHQYMQTKVNYAKHDQTWGGQTVGGENNHESILQLPLGRVQFIKKFQDCKGCLKLLAVPLIFYLF